MGSPTVSDGFVRNVGLTYRISYLIRHPLNGLQGYVDDPITEAEDVTQKIFFEFYRALQAFDPFISGIRTFLHSIANKRIIDRLRGAKTSRNTISYGLVSYKIEQREPYSSNPEDIVLNQNFVEIVKKVIDEKLTPVDRKIFIQHYFKGMTVAEIAIVLGMSRRSVYIRLSLIRARLKKEIDGDE